jgi:hypothetical protein
MGLTTRSWFVTSKSLTANEKAKRMKSGEKNASLPLKSLEIKIVKFTFT